MTDLGDIDRIEGIVLRSKQTTLRDVSVTQAMIDTGSDTITCLWRGNKQADLNPKGRYTFTGKIRYVGGRRIMLEPGHLLVQTSKPKSKPGPIPKKGNPAVGFVIIAVFISLLWSGISHIANHSTNQNTPSVTNASVATPASAAAAVHAPVDTPNDCDTREVPFTTTNRGDSSLPSGQTKLSPAGVNGQDKLCYVHGRNQSPTITHISTPTNEVKLVGTYVQPAPPPPTYSPSPAASCSGYINVDGNCIPSPSTTGSTVGGYSPTFTCVDGTFSYAQHSQGACSHHGGIAR